MRTTEALLVLALGACTAGNVDKPPPPLPPNTMGRVLSGALVSLVSSYDPRQISLRFEGGDLEADEVRVLETPLVRDADGFGLEGLFVPPGLFEIEVDFDGGSQLTQGFEMPAGPVVSVPEAALPPNEPFWIDLEGQGFDGGAAVVVRITGVNEVVWRGGLERDPADARWASNEQLLMVPGNVWVGGRDFVVFVYGLSIDTTDSRVLGTATPFAVRTYEPTPSLPQ